MLDTWVVSCGGNLIILINTCSGCTEKPCPVIAVILVYTYRDVLRHILLTYLCTLLYGWTNEYSNKILLTRYETLALHV